MTQLLELLGRGMLAELRVAFCGLLDDDPDRTTDDLEKSAARRTDSPHQRYLLGVRLLRQRKYGPARKAFEHALATPFRVWRRCRR